MFRWGFGVRVFRLSFLNRCLIAEVFGFAAEEIHFYRWSFSCRSSLWLVYGGSLPMPKCLALPDHVRGTILRMGRESPPAAASAKAYRAHALASTVLHARMSDLRGGVGDFRLSGEVEHMLEIP